MLGMAGLVGSSMYRASRMIVSLCATYLTDRRMKYNLSKRYLTTRLRVWDSTYRGRTGFTADHETGKSKGEGTAELRKIARESGTADMTADMAIRMVEGGSRTRAMRIEQLFDDFLPGYSATVWPDAEQFVGLHFRDRVNLDECAVLLGVSTRTLKRRWSELQDAVKATSCDLGLNSGQNVALKPAFGSNNSQG